MSSVASLVLMVVGLTIAQPNPESKYNRSMVSGVDTGTSIYFLVTDKKATFIKLDEKASKLVSLTDDKGTDLTQSKTKTRRWGRPKWLGSSSKISDDKHSLSFAIKGPSRPAKGATKILVKAKMVAIVGSDVKTGEQKDVPVKIGSKITAGPHPLEISKLGKGWNKKLPFTITIHGTKSFDAIKSVTFLDAAGKEIESKKSGSSRTHKSYGITYALGKKVDTVTVKIAYFAKVTPVEIPVDVKVGLGL
ncbi:MAG: hypothetical protein K8S55_00820 [Phycisphaerae bacterium]|nr:hypothetical protein [Phycisphaerae bacterium]